MNKFEVSQIIFYITTLVFLARPLGSYVADALEAKSVAQGRIFGPIENLIYRLCGINTGEQMNWKGYAGALLAFNVLGFLAVFLLQLFQRYLPLNPNGSGPIEWALAFNTAVSFMTNTNWQSYAGETTLSYLTQMLGLTVQNFLSAATGVAVFAALARGLSGKQTSNIGNFWADITRFTIRVLLPLSLFVALLLLGSGVVQTFKPNAVVKTLEGAGQAIPLGPAASQIAIKQIGTNGGGFFNANSAHPLENPTPLSNFIEMLSLLLLPVACVFAYGRMTGNKRHAHILLLVMFTIWAVGLGLALYSEYSASSTIGGSALMEGKETRFGVTNSVLWAVSTTAASNGSVNAMHSSLSPIAGGVAIFNIMLGEVIFGGVGAGMYGMLLFVLLTVFLCGLMVGRTPEYLGKKVEKREIQMAILGILAPSAVILVGAALTCAVTSALSSLSAKGPHGLSEILYAWSSASGNNGSAFAGLNANTAFYNIGLAIAMLIGRFAVIIPCLAIAGSMGGKLPCPLSAGTLPTDTPTFGVLLAAVIVVVGGLTFFPSLALGAIVEQLLMLKGAAF
ncbi:MAG: potassium-transporting ATPase subunit KdpA [Elusimicrobia bacterium RIFOXYA12_FULL_51_18]|nr:MAG: potassium-transporting ATPase subunit KdpA [Elusimicrobia bacterium RIFOXYA12_FULL_51_18]OGS28593.1 MAG: potassium-transporting ATPase subunit KdpA [Elusimicrobia bacterium RIFOXYA2_FULL_53_38]